MRRVHARRAAEHPTLKVDFGGIEMPSQPTWPQGPSPGHGAELIRCVLVCLFFSFFCS